MTPAEMLRYLDEMLAEFRLIEIVHGGGGGLPVDDHSAFEIDTDTLEDNGGDAPEEDT